MITDQVNIPWTIHRNGFHAGNLVETVTEQLDMTTEEVISELSAGISIADLAAAHGVDVQEIIDAFVPGQEEALYQAVESGQITQERADEMLEALTERITEKIDEPWDSHGCQPGMMRGHRRGGGSFPDSTEGQPRGFRGSAMQGTNL